MTPNVTRLVAGPIIFDERKLSARQMQARDLSADRVEHACELSGVLDVVVHARRSGTVAEQGGIAAHQPDGENLDACRLHIGADGRNASVHRAGAVAETVFRIVSVGHEDNVFGKIFRVVRLALGENISG